MHRCIDSGSWGEKIFDEKYENLHCVKVKLYFIKALKVTNLNMYLHHLMWRRSSPYAFTQYKGTSTCYAIMRRLRFSNFSKNDISYENHIYSYTLSKICILQLMYLPIHICKYIWIGASMHNINLKVCLICRNVKNGLNFM